ncbi:MAG: PIN domain-containing protein [Propionibacteriaceae bacterium]|nr:PIN domain-containing protein [Propionibacteriaceae bacterium]
MILVDTSVLIRVLGGRFDSPKAQLLNHLMSHGTDIAICPYVYQEILQGVEDDATYRRVKEYLDTQECLWLPQTLETFDRAARIFWDLRRSGVTVRSTIDVLIALTSIRHEVALLHDDRDFDHIAKHFPELMVVSA